MLKVGFGEGEFGRCVISVPATYVFQCRKYNISTAPTTPLILDLKIWIEPNIARNDKNQLQSLVWGGSSGQETEPLDVLHNLCISRCRKMLGIH